MLTLAGSSTASLSPASLLVTPDLRLARRQKTSKQTSITTSKQRRGEDPTRRKEAQNNGAPNAGMRADRGKNTGGALYVTS